MKNLTALVLAAGLAVSAGAASAMTDTEMMSMGHSMLTGSLYNSLTAQGFSTMGIEKLTLNEVVLLKSVLENADASDKKGQVDLIFERANAR
jgi:hypothetical protein